MKKNIVILASLLLIGCAHADFGWDYEATMGGYVNSPTGRYLVIKATPITVQHIWESIAPKDRCLMRVEAFTDWKRKQIWYCTEWGLSQELRNIQSYRNLTEAAKRDLRTAFPLIQPPRGLR